MSQGKGIRAGAAYVELHADESRLTRGLNAAAARVRAFGASVTSLGASLARFGALIAAPLALAAKAFADMGSDMLDMSQRTGLTVEALSELRFAAEQSGSSAAELEIAIKTMSKTIGSGGVSLDVRLGQVADMLASIEDPAERTARALAIFGKAGTKLLPMLLGGAAGLEAMRERARELGISMTMEDAVAAEAFGDQLSELWSTIRMGFFHIGGALVPALSTLATTLGDVIGEVRLFIKENLGLIKLAGVVVVALTGVGVALMLLGPAITIISVAFGAVSAVFSGMLAMFSPLGIAVAALVGGVGLLVGVFGNFGHVGGTVMTTLGGITEAIRAGDWALAAEIAWAGLKIVFDIGISSLRSAWTAFTHWFLDAWSRVVGMASDVWDRFQGWVTGEGRTVAQASQLIRDENGRIIGSQPISAPVVGVSISSDIDARREEREAAMAADQARIEAARRELEAMREQARIQREIAAGQAEEDLIGANRDRGGIGATVEAMRDKIEASGTFSGAAVAGLGAQSLTDTLKEANALATRANELLREIAGNVGGVAIA